MRALAMLLMVLVFFGLLIGANVYLANRFSFFFAEGEARWLYAIFPVSTVFIMGSVIGFTNSLSSIGHMLFMVGAVTMGFFLYVLLSTLVIDLSRLVTDFQPMVYGLLVLFISGAVSLYGLWHATQIKETEVTIKLPNLTMPIRAAHLTDTHLGHFRGGDKLSEIVNRINAQNVEVVFFTGDLLDAALQLKPEAMQPLQNLNAPIYFVDGNHDEYTGVKAINDYLRSIGVQVLENEVAQWNELQVVGLNFMVADSTKSSPHASTSSGTVQSTLASLPIDRNKPTVMLHHGPDGIKYANEAGVNLYLAGHTHAGQMWPATYVAKAMFEYNRGLHSYKGTQVYVSQGTGTFGPPMRVGTDAELAFLNLVPEK